MASNINPFNIDGSFPVAGQDNSSQGFRDNFTNIRNNLGYAKSEIEDLQNKAILKSGLTGTSVSNDMAGTVLYQPTLKSYFETVYNQSLVSGAVAISYTNGNVQKIITDGDCTLAFDGWPSSGLLGKITVWVSVSSIDHKLGFAVVVPGITIGLTDISGCNSATGIITFESTGDYLFEFSTMDGGQNIMIRDLSRNYDTFRGTTIYYNNAVSNAVMLGYNNALTNGITNIEKNSTHSVSTYGSQNSVTVGDLSQANVAYHRTDVSTLGGYSITAARGNLVANTAFGSTNAVKTGDYVGFVEAVAFTGNGAGNTFSQISSINFFAKGDGSNTSYTYGVGGNVAIFTKSDQGLVSQAIGVENNQKTKFYGNIIVPIKPDAGNWITSSSGYPGTPGEIVVDQGYLYVCVAVDTWKRVAITSAGW